MPAPVPLPPPDLRVRDLAGSRVGVWGAGREGLAAVRALTVDAPGAEVVLYAPDPPALGAPVPDHVRCVHGDEGLGELAACETVIRSPGVPVRGADADRVRAGGATITSGTALWLAQRLPTETVVGVTGTKGKSTTASLLHHLLERAGARSRLAGNIGRPLLDLLHPDGRPDVWVVELSSYQLADLPRAPTVAVVGNLLRDHIPWHRDEATYHADKLRILAEAPAPGAIDPPPGAGTPLSAAVPTPRMAVLSHADPVLRAAGERLSCPVTWVDRGDGLHVAAGALRDGARVLCALTDLPLRGVTGARNVALALATLRALGYDVEDPATALRDFRPLPHRQQVVADPRDVARITWVDDSISTTPEAALAAIAAFAPGPVVLLAGGLDRDQHQADLTAALATGWVPTGAAGEPPVAVQVAGLVALPGTGGALADAVAGAAASVGASAPIPVRRIEYGDPDTVMAAAVAAARDLAPPGATVLLSPAAPSHNVFRDFEDRGDRFAAAVRRG